LTKPSLHEGCPPSRAIPPPGFFPGDAVLTRRSGNVWKNIVHDKRLNASLAKRISPHSAAEDATFSPMMVADRERTMQAASFYNPLFLFLDSLYLFFHWLLAAFRFTPSFLDKEI
jgi:hypothetical protein